MDDYRRVMRRAAERGGFEAASLDSRTRHGSGGLSRGGGMEVPDWFFGPGSSVGTPRIVAALSGIVAWLTRLGAR